MLNNRRSTHKRTDAKIASGTEPNLKQHVKRERTGCRGLLEILLALNVVVMTCLLRKDGGWWHTGTTASSIGTLSNTGAIQVNDSSFIEKKEGHQQQQQRDFYSIAKEKGTDKVAALRLLEHCSKGEGKDCTRPGCKNPKCRPWGHYYHTMYQQHLGHLSTDDSAPFQFLEIGFYNGNGFDAYREFLPRAETHSIEISCIDEGPRSEGKWPWGNFAAKNSNYKTYLKQRRLHCGDANDVEFLHKIWTNEMNRTSAPPLKVVVDDGAHVAEHMAQSVFFWLPRLEVSWICALLYCYTTTSIYANF